MDDLTSLKKKAGENILGAKTVEELEAARVTYLGRKGLVTERLRGLKDLSLDKRKRLGGALNVLRHHLEEIIEQRRGQLTVAASEEIFPFDPTKPGKRVQGGSLHPLSQIEEAIRKIFVSMNFSIVEGPELEREFYNFNALNMPPDHPARDMQDTFWIKCDDRKDRDRKLGQWLLRTHTSPMQVRYMEQHKPPFQIIVPGRVFRYEALDASHEFNFSQIEGLMVGPDVTLANFKFVIETFLKELFGDSISFRFRPSYFPFVEPGVEVDVKLKGSWLELMGAGMVHRNVFNAVRYDHREIQGFAFGIGLERLAMILYNVPDIRLFYSGDIRFTRQF